MEKTQLLDFARRLGFADARFADADDTLLKPGFKQPRTLLEGASCIVVLFMPYKPSAPPEKGLMALSAYYAASHASFHAARSAADYIREAGARALHTTAINAKEAALRTGGFLGDNGFYYHPRLGSFVCIQTVLTDAFAPDARGKTGSGCLHCGACTAACPSGALGTIERCLRYHLNGLVPETLRNDVYQLLGCEKCQSACPLNASETSAPISFPLERIFSGEAVKRLRELAGPNMARRGRILSQAVLYAAATGQTAYIDDIKKLAENEGEPIASHARWALMKLNGENK